MSSGLELSSVITSEKTAVMLLKITYIASWKYSSAQETSQASSMYGIFISIGKMWEGINSCIRSYLIGDIAPQDP